MHPALRQVDHRPFPIPDRPWRMRQSWCDLLFAHWPVSAQQLRPHIPEEFEIDQFDGTAWLGVVPFRMADVAPRGVPAIPGISAFPEINVRTYVTYNGVPGVWFHSLDASKKLAVWAARTFFHLPYYLARMSCRDSGEGISYSSARFSPSQQVDFSGSYRPTSEPYLATKNTLEHWLTERYCLFTTNKKGQVFRGDIHHAPWPLQSAEAQIDHNSMTAPLGIQLDHGPAHLHFAKRIDVVIWSLTQLS